MLPLQGCTYRQLTAQTVMLLQAGGDDEEDVGALAAFGCLRALSTVLESVSALPHLFPQLEEVLFPLFERMCSQEGLDVLEEVLQLISYCIYFPEKVCCSDSCPSNWSTACLLCAWTPMTCHK